MTNTTWDQHSVKALRRHLGFNQVDFAAEIGVRQQTVSEWERGKYIPRGATAKLLTMAKERSAFSYPSPFDALAMEALQEDRDGETVSIEQLAQEHQEENGEANAETSQ